MYCPVIVRYVCLCVVVVVPVVLCFGVFLLLCFLWFRCCGYLCCYGDCFCVSVVECCLCVHIPVVGLYVPVDGVLICIVVRLVVGRLFLLRLLFWSVVGCCYGVCYVLFTVLYVLLFVFGLLVCLLLVRLVCIWYCVVVVVYWSTCISLLFWLGWVLMFLIGLF